MKVGIGFHGNTSFICLFIWLLNHLVFKIKGMEMLTLGTHQTKSGVNPGLKLVRLINTYLGYRS